MAEWQEPKIDYVGGDDVTPDIFNNIGKNQKYLKEKQDKKIEITEVKDADIISTIHTSRQNISATEKLKVAFGKIRRWLTDLKALAFKDKVSDEDIENVNVDKVDGIHNVAKTGNYNELNNKPSITKQAIGISEVENERQYSESNPPPYPVKSVNGKTQAVNINKNDIGLNNVDNIKQYSATNPPPYPVTSVNGQTGNVNLPESEVQPNGSYPNLTVGNSTKLGGYNANNYVMLNTGEKILKRKDLWTGEKTTNGSLSDIFTSSINLNGKLIEIEYSANGLLSSNLVVSAFSNARRIVKGRFPMRTCLVDIDNSFQALAEVYFRYNTSTKTVSCGTIASKITHSGAYANGGHLERVYSGRIDEIKIFRISVIEGE